MTTEKIKEQIKKEIEEKRNFLIPKIPEILSKERINDKSKVRIIQALLFPTDNDDDIIVDRLYEGWDEIEDYE